jgi:hypothetical protein
VQQGSGMVGGFLPVWAALSLDLLHAAGLQGVRSLVEHECCCIGWHSRGRPPCKHGASQHATLAMACRFDMPLTTPLPAQPCCCVL